MSEGERRRTILLVDDEQENLIVLSALLERDYEVRTASSAEEALAVLEDSEIDLMVTDQRMPGTSGVELLSQVRLRHPHVVRMVLTAYTDIDVMLDAVNEGSVYCYIIKPWAVDQMRATLRQAFQWADMRREHGEMAAELARANQDLAARNRELSEMREQLLAEEKLAAVGRFAAEMAHEMANHLVAVQAVAAELDEEANEPALCEAVGILLAGTEQLVAIVRDIRLFAGGGRLEPEMELLKPHEIVRQVVEMCRRSPTLRHARIEVEGPDVGWWKLDRVKLMHLLFNLVRNAMQATEPGRAVRVTLTPGQESLAFAVEDRGPGIPEALLDRIFEPFFTTRGEDGTGLGLTICRWVAHMHGGSLEHAAMEPSGARFTFTVPRIP